MSDLWVDTGWACGYLAVEDNVITDSAPVWRKWIGSTWTSFRRRHVKRFSVLGIVGGDDVVS